MPRKAASARMGTALFDRYAPLPGVPDELVDAQGAMRPAWRAMLAHLSGHSRAEIEMDIARGAQHLADAGVFFRNYGEAQAQVRDWPFSPVPVILPEAEWDSISAGLVQRAEVMEAVVADLYGDNRLVAEGHLPATLITDNPEWLRPMVGVRPRSGHFLHFLAFEIGRGPDGGWWVLADRTDAPSGAGFALENRVAASRVFPQVFRDSNVHRLAAFFRSFRDALDGMRRDPASRVGILTPGPLTDTYYEQAYIARYLGLSLLEGEDLTVDGGRVNIRTVQGLTPVDVLWRRMDGIWADPLELRPDSALGTPGLMAAVRQGQVSMVNALGAGVLETQALMAFLPAIARHLTGEALRLPNVATWWCGAPKELAHVRAHAARMMIGPALSTRLPFESNAPHAIGGQVRGGPEGSLDDWLTTEGPGLMAKELVTLSTTPVWEDGRLVPRPMSLRVFLARTKDGWQVMPGGFARLGRSDDTTAISMRNGGRVADVWVAGTAPVTPVSLLTPPTAPFRRSLPGPLPARAADNLFWLGRYVERTEGLLRLVRAYQGRLETAPPGGLMTRVAGQLAGYGLKADEPLPQGVQDTLASAVHSASQIRDRFSVDGWQALQDMQKSMRRIARRAEAGNDAAHVASVMLRKIAGFSGLVHDNMYRAEGWQFLSVGRALERAAMTCDLLAGMTDPAAPAGGLDLAIEVGDSIMVHRQRHAVATSRETVIDLLGLDDRNPRSVRFQIDLIRARMDDLSALHPPGQMSGFDRQVVQVQATMTLHSVTTLTPRALRDIRGQLFALTPALSDAYLI